MALAEQELTPVTPALSHVSSDRGRGGIDDIAEKVYAGERITGEDALRLFHHTNIVELGQLADFVRRQKHPDNVVSYIGGRNIN